ncbi:hypothetical protein LJR186_001202 [Microbacterium foliorum]
MTTENYHHVELKIADGELRTGFTCVAPIDAPCRKRPKDSDQRESWTVEEATETGFRCWAVEWVEAVGVDEAIVSFPDRVLASVPVLISFSEGVEIEPAVIYCDYCGVSLPSVKHRADVPTTPDLQRMGFDAAKVVCPVCVRRARDAARAQ